MEVRILGLLEGMVYSQRKVPNTDIVITLCKRAPHGCNSDLETEENSTLQDCMKIECVNILFPAI